MRETKNKQKPNDFLSTKRKRQQVIVKKYFIWKLRLHPFACAEFSLHGIYFKVNKKSSQNVYFEEFKTSKWRCRQNQVKTSFLEKN